MDTSERILFVDDDPQVRTAFSRSMRSLGFQLDLADGFDEAYALAEKASYAVIITDYRMPRVNGLELIGKMRDIQPHASYMLVSAEVDLDLALEAVNTQGATFVLRKPWDTEELGSMVRRSLDAHFEHVGQMAVTKNMVQASKSLEDQKRKLEDAVINAETRMAEMMLSALDMRQYETRAHCVRVAQYSLVLAKAMGLKGRVLATIEQGALLHDVGSLGIPDAIMLKGSPLTPEEWQVVRQHPETGAKFLEGLEQLKGARDIIRQHHERWDGTGYPLGLAGSEICLGARIFMVADALDALTTDRAYRRAVSFDAAVAEITNCSGSQFDPDVVTAFLRVPKNEWLQIRDANPDGREKSNSG